VTGVRYLLADRKTDRARPLRLCPWCWGVVNMVYVHASRYGGANIGWACSIKDGMVKSPDFVGDFYRIRYTQCGRCRRSFDLHPLVTVRPVGGPS
jgi:hypothetical protein